MIETCGGSASTLTSRFSGRTSSRARRRRSTSQSSKRSRLFATGRSSGAPTAMHRCRRVSEPPQNPDESPSTRAAPFSDDHQTRLMESSPRSRHEPARGAQALPQRLPGIGDEVLAVDGLVGRIEEVVSTDSAVPRYLIVSAGRLRRRHPVIPVGLITDVDDDGVRVRGSRHRLQRLPESLPLVF